MQAAIEFGGHADHSVLRAFMDGTKFVGVRVFRSDRSLVFESWTGIPDSLVAAAKLLEHPWPQKGKSHRQWVDVADEKLIQIVLPLHGANGAVVGFVEGISRLNSDALREQRSQVLVGAWSASLAVLLAVVLLYPVMAALLNHSGNLSRQLLDANLSLLRALGNAIAKRDSDTDAHNYRVTCYAVGLAEALAMPPGDIADLVVGAFLHDVGKIGIPDRVLKKTGKLDDGEFMVMKSHVTQGSEIVKDNVWLSGAGKVIRHHHERFDGTGYPDQLHGEAIPLGARVFAVVDVFDALTSIRPYKPAMPLPEALSILEKSAGSHFDPTVVATFLPIADSLYAKTYCASETQLKQAMQAMFQKYFDSQAALWNCPRYSGHGVLLN